MTNNKHSLSIEDLPIEIVNLAYQEAHTAIRNDIDFIARLQRRTQNSSICNLIAIIVLLGTLVGTLAGNTKTMITIVMPIYGIAVFSISVGVMWAGMLFDQTISPEGSSPTEFLSESVLYWLNYHPKEDWERFIKTEHLKELQERHKKNVDLSEDMQAAYELSIMITVIGFIVGIVILICLLSIHH